MIAHAIQGREHRAQRHRAAAEHARRRRSSTRAPTARSCLIATSATLVGLVPWMVESGAVTAGVGRRRGLGDVRGPDADGRRARPPARRRCARRSPRSRCSTRKMELFEGGIARGVTLAPVNTVADVLAMEHLAVRDYWDERHAAERADAARRRAVRQGVRARRSRGPARRPTSASTPARCSTRSTAPSATAGAAAATPSRRPTPAPPARGREGGRLLVDRRRADHGQGARRPRRDRRPRRARPPADRLRLVGPFKDDIPGINRCQFFGSFNTSKLSLQLDLKHPAGNDVARQLLAWCDIALDSFTAGTMGELGLGYDVARALNPDIIMATTCLLGQNGPAAQLAGYGYHAAAVSGFYEITGWDDRPPAGPFNAYTDTIAPRFLTTRCWPPSTTAGAPARGSSSTRRRWSRRCTSSRPSCSTSRCPASAPAATATTTRTTRPTTPTRAPASTSGARSPSRPTSSGARCARCSASRRGRWTRRSTPLPGGWPAPRRSTASSAPFTAAPRGAAS